VVDCELFVGLEEGPGLKPLKSAAVFRRAEALRSHRRAKAGSEAPNVKEKVQQIAKIATAKAKARATATATAKANTGILRFAQNDDHE
jgi:hypothetical protein